MNLSISRRTKRRRGRRQSWEDKRRGREFTMQRQGGTREHFVNISGSKPVARFPSVTKGCRLRSVGGGWKRERERVRGGRREQRGMNPEARKRFQTSAVACASQAKWDVLAVDGGWSSMWKAGASESWGKLRRKRGGVENEATRDSDGKRNVRQEGRMREQQS